MLRTHKTIVTIALLNAAVLSLAWAAQPGNNAHNADMAVRTGVATSPESCAEMKNMCDDMTSKQKERDTRLNRLVSTMNDASGQAKVDAMAAVISELVTQRNETRAHTMHTDVAMKEHMLRHVMDAAPADMREKMKKDMEGCSMMKVSASEDR